MNRQFILLLISVISGVFASVFHFMLDLNEISEKIPVVIAVFMAALFVRLARGVPPFPFEKISQSNSLIILESLAHLRKMYSYAFASFMFSIVISLSYTLLMQNINIIFLKSAITGVFIFSISWATSMAYLIYKTDIALFKAQKIAIEQVVSDLASNSAEVSVKTVQDNLRPNNPL